jgi:hypothetical protein
MKKITYPSLLIDLQLFAEGGADTGAEGAPGVTPEAAVQEESSVMAMTLDEALGKKPVAAVEEKPKQTAAPSAKKAEKIATDDERKAAYEAFLKEHKDLDDSRVQSIVQKRVKGLHEKLETYKKYDSVHEILAKKYGIDASDADALAKAVEADDSLLEDEAFKRGTTVDELRHDMRYERRMAEINQREKAIQQKEQAELLYNRWSAEAEKLKEIYPQFDLRTELGNPEFRAILSLEGMSMKTAYNAIHADEIIPSAMQYAAEQTEKHVTDTIKANGTRPTDVGASPAASYKSNVSELTDKDIDRINELVLRGAKITL